MQIGLAMGSCLVRKEIYNFVGCDGDDRSTYTEVGCLFLRFLFMQIL